MSAEDFCSRVFFSPEGLWHKNKNRRQDSEYYSRATETVPNSTTSPWIMRRLQSGYFPEHFSSVSLPLVFFMRNRVMWSTWLIIPPLSTADPAYGAAWSSEGRAHAVSPVFGWRRRCRLSNLKKKKHFHVWFNQFSLCLCSSCAEWGPVSVKSPCVKDETVQTVFTDQLLMGRASHAWPHCRADSSHRINFITQSSASRLPSLWQCERWWERIIWEKWPLK